MGIFRETLNNQASRLSRRIAKAESKGNTSKVNDLRTKLNDVNSRINANTASLLHLNAIKNDQQHAYTFKQLPTGSKKGGTSLGIAKNSAGKYQVAIVMSIVSDANAVHEITHGYQGGIKHSIIFKLNRTIFPGSNLFAKQMADAISEIEAYKAQYGFDPSTIPPSTRGGTPQNMNYIDAYYISGIYDDSKPTSKLTYPNVRDMVNTIFQRLIKF